MRKILTRRWGDPSYVNVMNIHMEASVPLSAYLSEIPRPYFIVAMVFGFVWFWPAGLVVLAYLLASGRMRRRGSAPGRWHNTATPQDGGGFGWGAGGSLRGWWRGEQPTSSNRAFDDYRAETIRRLEEEQKEFMEYLERLRQARDKQEFDSFMAERRRSGPAADVPAAS